MNYVDQNCKSNLIYKRELQEDYNKKSYSGVFANFQR